MNNCMCFICLSSKMNDDINIKPISSKPICKNEDMYVFNCKQCTARIPVHGQCWHDYSRHCAKWLNVEQYWCLCLCMSRTQIMLIKCPICKRDVSIYEEDLFFCKK